ncbi:MAG: hypothetical protein HC845_15935 [Akkermansiaceae bacterium]|nr:hypothetical protein [Akkermansiaceae bacterium]
MYLSEFFIDDVAFKQGCVQIRKGAARHHDKVDNWWIELNTSIQKFEMVNDGHHSIRIILDENGYINYLIIALAPNSSEEKLRSYLASFTRLDNISGGSIYIPVSRSEHDQIMSGFPTRQHRINAHEFVVDDIYFACNFRAWNELTNLFAEAGLFEYTVGYQCQFFSC